MLHTLRSSAAASGPPTLTVAVAQDTSTSAIDRPPSAWRNGPTRPPRPASLTTSHSSGARQRMARRSCATPAPGARGSAQPRAALAAATNPGSPASPRRASFPRNGRSESWRAPFPTRVKSPPSGLVARGGSATLALSIRVDKARQRHGHRDRDAGCRRDRKEILTVPSAPVLDQGQPYLAAEAGAVGIGGDVAEAALRPAGRGLDDLRTDR